MPQQQLLVGEAQAVKQEALDGITKLVEDRKAEETNFKESLPVHSDRNHYPILKH